MSAIIETIELTERSRLRIEHDADAENPRLDYVTATGFVKVDGKGDSRLADVPAVHEPPVDILEAYHRFRGSNVATFTDVMWRRDAEAIDLTYRWARVFHDLALMYDFEHGGFWFVGPDADEPRDFVRQIEVIKQEQETYRQWAEGEVYGVILERLTSWCRMLDDGTADRLDTREEWEEEGAIWSNYLSDTYTAETVALEFFELTDDETAALKARKGN